ncbi:hypothetical protein BS50DRAFT_637806 [Corynespora cassiicola Philippines]|uniref:Uncharacterized protein n=1 Tax=Corynespora cassiicola Philippines TaxID=1448308 RepID=A0A2T2NDJ2_CORCC|nr:hypothetical protein BS50DRAFT_637806 [Corynespora cassiicola Philippines]
MSPTPSYLKKPIPTGEMVPSESLDPIARMYSESSDSAVVKSGSPRSSAGPKSLPGHSGEAINATHMKDKKSLDFAPLSPSSSNKSSEGDETCMTPVGEAVKSSLASVGAAPPSPGSLKGLGEDATLTFSRDESTANGIISSESIGLILSRNFENPESITSRESSASRKRKNTTDQDASKHKRKRTTVSPSLAQSKKSGKRIMALEADRPKPYQKYLESKILLGGKLTTVRTPKPTPVPEATTYDQEIRAILQKLDKPKKKKTKIQKLFKSHKNKERAGGPRTFHPESNLSGEDLRGAAPIPTPKLPARGDANTFLGRSSNNRLESKPGTIKPGTSTISMPDPKDPENSVFKYLKPTVPRLTVAPGQTIHVETFLDDPISRPDVEFLGNVEMDGQKYRKFHITRMTSNQREMKAIQMMAKRRQQAKIDRNNTSRVKSTTDKTTKKYHIRNQQTASHKEK